MLRVIYRANEKCHDFCVISLKNSFITAKASELREKEMSCRRVKTLLCIRLIGSLACLQYFIRYSILIPETFLHIAKEKKLRIVVDKTDSFLCSTGFVQSFTTASINVCGLSRCIFHKKKSKKLLWKFEAIVLCFCV